jgi:hypothetical protein
MQYCSVKKIAKPETLVETLYVTSLQGLTKAVLSCYGLNEAKTFKKNNKETSFE